MEDLDKFAGENVINNAVNDFFKPVIAGETITWHRPEQNIVYLLAEFIDNSKASYEHMIKDYSYSKNIEKMPIDVVFNQQLGFIAVKDEGLGFNIQKSTEKIGREGMNVGSTNQYFIGMKAAMNYFGNFSIIVSERIVNGINRRYANYFIFKNGLHPTDFELESRNKTGSEIYLFNNYHAAYNFWNSLKFKEKNLKPNFPPAEILNLSRNDNYSITEEVLDGIRTIFPILSASLFERYSPLVNRYPQIEIRFSIFNKEGMDINNNENSIRLEVPNRARAYPQFFKIIKSNDWETDRSFSFERLLSSSEINDTKTFKKKLNTDPLFRAHFERLLFNDIKNHFNKAKAANVLLDEIKVANLGKSIDYEVNWISNGFARFYNFADEKLWNEYPFAKDLAAIFMNNLLKHYGSFSHIEFEIINLTLNPYREILTSRNYEDETFELTFDLNILSNRYLSDPNYRWGPISSDNMAGFSLIQNNRALYHGPNFDPLSRDYVSWPKEWPTRFLANELKNGNPKAFPFYYSSKNYPTFVSTGGNTSRWTSKIFGSITLPDGDVFNAGTNKAQVSNLKSLENFVLDVLRDCAINVFSRWIHLFDQKAVVGNPSLQQIKNYNRNAIKNRDGVILLDILHSIEEEEKRKNGALDRETGEIDTVQLKDTIGSKVYKNLKRAILGESQLDYELPELIAKDEKSIANYALDFLKTAKNNQWSILKIKKIELNEMDHKTIIIQLDKTFRKWKQILAIKFDSHSNTTNWSYVLEDDEPIIITIPLDVTKMDIPTLTELINKQLRKLYYHLTMIIGFFQISLQKKVNPRASINWTEEIMETYLANALDNFIDVPF